MLVDALNDLIRFTFRQSEMLSEICKEEKTSGSMKRFLDVSLQLAEGLSDLQRVNILDRRPDY